MRSIVASHQKLTTVNWDQSLTLTLLQLHEKLLKNSVSTNLQSFSIWSKLERWKCSLSGRLMNWLKISLKKSSFWSVLFSYSTQHQQTISRSDCDMWPKVDFVWKPVTITSVAGPRRSSKAFPKAKLAPEKVLVTVWWSAAGLDTAFWTLAKPSHLRIMLRKLMKLQCLQLAMVNRKSPVLLHDNIQLTSHYQCF